MLNTKMYKTIPTVLNCHLSPPIHTILAMMYVCEAGNGENVNYEGVSTVVISLPPLLHLIMLHYHNHSRLIYEITG